MIVPTGVTHTLKKRLTHFLPLVILLALSGCATVPYPPATPSSGGTFHIVGSGQTLYGISKSYGVDLKEVMRLNGIQDPNRIGVGDKLFIPRQTAPVTVVPYPARTETQEPVALLVGPKQHRVRWRYITLHHSATSEGNAEAFDRNHRQRKMGGLAYHFVIGNGTGSGDGEIEVGWRWTRQREASRREDIQICLVGNFNEQEVSTKQYASLVALVRTLTKQYGIPLSHVRRNKDVRGRATECPGRNFPYYRLLAELRSSG